MFEVVALGDKVGGTCSMSDEGRDVGRRDMDSWADKLSGVVGGQPWDRILATRRARALTGQNQEGQQVW